MIKCKNSCPLGKFEGCCVECPEKDDCPDSCQQTPQDCGEAVFEGTEIEVFQNKAAAVIQQISQLVKQKAEIEAAEKAMREQLQKAMEAGGVTKFDNDIIKVTYVDASTRETIDSAKLKAQMPEVAAKFMKTSNVKAHVKIELKGDKKK